MSSIQRAVIWGTWMMLELLAEAETARKLVTKIFKERLGPGAAPGTAKGGTQQLLGATQFGEGLSMPRMGSTSSHGISLLRSHR